MVEKRLSCFLCVVLCIFSMTAPASARASDYLESYWTDAYSTNGQICVAFSVSGTDTMANIGCESIVIKEKLDGLWEEVDSRDEWDRGMTKKDAMRHANTIYIDCETSKYYQVIVTIYAEGTDGNRDTRQETFYVTCRN